MDREEKTLLAGELALGLLEGDERRDALHLVSVDPVARAEFARWQGRFATFAEEVPAVKFGAAPRIRDRLAAVTGDEPARSWRQEIAHLLSQTSWTAPMIAIKAALILYLILLLL